MTLMTIRKYLSAQNPLLIQPVERPGRYGGTWRRGMLGGRDHASLIRTRGYENLMRWDAQWTRVLPNVAQSVFFTLRP